MAELKTLQGILALVDIVNFTGQAAQLGDQYTAQYSTYFQDKIKTISERHGFNVVKSMGDAVLFFGSTPEGILDIMMDLFLTDKPGNKFGFISRFRMVAHSGFFQFETEDDKLIDLVSPEGIKVFRMEKFAQSWELVVTQNLYQGIKPLLTQKNIEAVRMVLNEPLKGFDSEEWNPPIYKLRVVKENKGVSNLLERRMNELENEVQSIPVFGNIYPAVPMEKNFINLFLVCDDERFITNMENCLKEKGKYIKQRPIEKGEWPFHDPDREEEYRRRSRIDDIDVPTLYEKFRGGIIMGLPGAGKTTILRHLAYKEFKTNESQPADEKRVVLFVQCKDVPFYDKWYQERHGAAPGEPGCEEALSFMIWGFLFGKKIYNELTPEELVEFQNAENKVEQAFKANRLILLVDALDEAQDSDTRERIKQLFYVLNSENRLYLTSRPSEGIHLDRDIKRHNIPLFKVLSLNMEQVRNVAGNLLKEDSPIYKKFSEDLWKEEVVVKMAATPLTALLVTAYFQAYEKFDHRYPMYNLLMKFILLKAWENIKTGMFPYKNMELFFQEIKSPDFFDKQKETEILYHALASLCFDLFYEDVDGVVQRSINEEVMEKYFISFILERMSFSYNEKAAEAVAAKWKEQLHRDHLLLQAGAGKYVFVHSTFMEFLAAYHLVERAKKDAVGFPALVRQCAGSENFLELETLPIAAGSSLTTGYDVLRFMGNLVKEVSYPERIKRLGVKSLSEVEWLLHKTFSVIRMKSMRKLIDDIVDRNRLAVKWVYLYLKETLLTEDKEQLKEHTRRFESVLKLSRPTFLEEFLDYNQFDKGDSELVELRRQLLLKVLQKELVEKWFEKHQKVRLDYNNILQLDTPGYHPEDKNFNYYRELIGKELNGFFGSPNFKHSGPIKSCSFSPDGKTIVSASLDNTLKLWGMESGKEIRSFIGHKNHVLCCAFSPDGKTIISASGDNTLKLWDVKSGKEIRSFSGHTNIVYGCAFSPDAKTILSASDDKTLKLWDAGSGKEIRSFIGHTSTVYDCAFSPDSKTILSASRDNTLKLWDPKNGREILTFTGHTSYVNGCAFSPDGKTILSASEDNTLKLWDSISGKEIRSFIGHMSYVMLCAFSPDGKTIISSYFDKTLKLWDVGSGREIRSFSGHKAPIYGCAFSPDGKTITSASDDHTLKVWDVRNGKEIRLFNGHKEFVTSCVFSPDFKTIISASKDNTLKLWNLTNGKEIRSFVGHTKPVLGCAISPDAKTILSASSDNTLKRWEVDSGKEIQSYVGHTNTVYACVFSPEGNDEMKILSASEDGTLKLWYLEGGKKIYSLKGHNGAVYDCAFSPDGKTILSASSDNTLKLWNSKSGEEICSLTGHTDHVWRCIFSPNGMAILSASGDNTLKLWDTGSGKEIRSFKGHNDWVRGCAFSPDGKIIISASFDKTLKLWDVGSGKELKSLTLPWIPNSLSSSPSHDQFIAITANLNGTVTVFEFDELK